MARDVEIAGDENRHSSVLRPAESLLDLLPQDDQILVGGSAHLQHFFRRFTGSRARSPDISVERKPDREDGDPPPGGQFDNRPHAFERLEYGNVLHDSETAEQRNVRAAGMKIKPEGLGDLRPRSVSLLQGHEIRTAAANRFDDSADSVLRPIFASAMPKVPCHAAERLHLIRVCPAAIDNHPARQQPEHQRDSLPNPNCAPNHRSNVSDREEGSDMAKRMPSPRLDDGAGRCLRRF